MLGKLQTPRGLSLIELTVVIIVVGILTSVAMKSMTNSLEDVRRLKTERELQRLAAAIVGDPALTANGHRTDFGYVGDIGAFPPTLSALISNPGYATWKGPYLRQMYSSDTLGYKIDEWGKPYSYAGMSITSLGNGSPIAVRLADAATDYLRNPYYAQVFDVNDSMPGLNMKDSVAVLVTIPNGAGGTLTKTYRPSITGTVEMDSLPVGQHPVKVIFEPQNDTLYRYITVLPRNKTLLPTEFKFTKNYFQTALDASLTKIVASDSIISYSPSCDGFSFWIRNNTGGTRTITSIKLTYGAPVAYYRYVRWNGTTVVNTSSPRTGSGHVAAFSTTMSMAQGQTARIQFESFKTSASGGGSSVNMQNSTFTIEFSDGSILTVSTGACN